MKKIIVASVTRNGDNFFGFTAADAFVNENVDAIRNCFMLKAIRYFGVRSVDCNVELEEHSAEVTELITEINQRGNGYYKAMDKVVFDMLFDSIVDVTVANL